MSASFIGTYVIGFILNVFYLSKGAKSSIHKIFVQVLHKNARNLKETPPSKKQLVYFVFFNVVLILYVSILNVILLLRAKQLHFLVFISTM